MNNIRTLVLTFVLFMSFFVTVHAAPDIASLDVVMQNYDPYPAQPGSYITLKFRATNTGGGEAENVEFELMPEYPFSLDPGVNKIQKFGSVDQNDNIVFEYKVRYTNDGWYLTSEEFNILVSITESVLSINSVTTNPETLRPGETSKLILNLANLAGTGLRDISVKLDLETQNINGQIIDLPFTPKSSTTEKKMRFLDGNSETEMVFDLLTYPDAESRVYKIPMTVTYTDEAGSTFSTTDLVGVVVGAEPKLDLSIDSARMSPGISGEVTIRLVNRGVTNLKFLTLELSENDDFEIASTSDSVYIGNLDSDDFDTATFNIRPMEGQKVLSLPLKLMYSDANNNEYEKDVELELDMSNAQPLQAASGNSGPVIVVVIVIGILAYLVIRKRRKKRRK